MADIKISALPTATTPLTGAELVPIVQGGVTKQTTTSDVLAVPVTSLTASSAVATDASKKLVSVANTGTGDNVLATSPTLVTPILGTPQSVTLTNATGLPLTTGVTGLLPVANGGTGTATPALVAGSNVSITGSWPNQTINSSAPGTGTVTSVSVVSANGLAGTVANATTTPAITLSTSVTGVVKGNGTTLSAATAGTDYVAPGGALGTPSSGTVTNLTGTASININGTVGATTPAAVSATALSATGDVNFVATNNRIVATDNASFTSWQGSSTQQNRGYFIQRENDNAGFFGLSAGSNRSVAFEANFIGGTFASKTGTPSGSTARMRFNGYDATNGISVGTAEFRLVATEDWTPIAHGTKADVIVTPNGSITSVLAATFDGSGNVGIGNSSPAVPLQIGNGTANATLRFGATSNGYDISRDNSSGYFVQNATQASPYNQFIWQQSGVERMRIDASGNVLVTSAALLGYGIGSGGTVTQATSKSTAVTLNKPTGQITMNNAALAAGATVQFVLNNSLLSANDVIYVQRSSGGTNNVYQVWADSCIAGGSLITIKNGSATNYSEAIVITFVVIKGSTS